VRVVNPAISKPGRLCRVVYVVFQNSSVLRSNHDDQFGASMFKLFRPIILLTGRKPPSLRMSAAEGFGLSSITARPIKGEKLRRLQYGLEDCDEYFVGNVTTALA